MSNFEKKVVPYLTYLGTRPILQDELRQYELHHRARIAIKPGITGMWQVSGRSDITDLAYILVQITRSWIAVVLANVLAMLPYEVLAPIFTIKKLKNKIEE